LLMLLALAPPYTSESSESLETDRVMGVSLLEANA
jgi:hypothetical protein